MNKDELLSKVSELESASNNLEGMAQAVGLAEIAKLKISIHGMDLDEIATKMAAITLPNLAKMDDYIQSASSANKTHDARVSSLNRAISFIKNAIGIVT